MTRKDYEIIASAVKNAGDRLDYYGWRGYETTNALKEVAWHLSLKLKQDNERFNPDKFFEACGWDPGEVVTLDEDKEEAAKWA